jgi:chemotaxis receptor (MCP) glutamine deamidase CheD
MQHLSARLSESAPKEIKVGTNECRLARNGDRMVARGVLADVVVTVQVPSADFAAMLRFSVPEEAGASGSWLEALADFADQALALLFESIRSMDIPPEGMTVSVMGGAEVAANSHGRQLASAVQQSLQRQGVTLNGTDLGGTQSRSIWLDSSSGRLIVRSASQPPTVSAKGLSATDLSHDSPPAATFKWPGSVSRTDAPLPLYLTRDATA